MSTFDPVTFSAIQKLKREVGEVTLVHSQFHNDDTWIDTGTFFDPNQYPDLADKCKTAPDITDFTEMVLPTLSPSTPTQVLQAQPKITGLYDPNATGTPYVIDTASRVYTLDGSGLTYVSTITDPQTANALPKAFVFFNSSYYVFYNSSIYSSPDAVTWTLVDQTLFLDSTGAAHAKITWAPTMVRVLNGTLYVDPYYTTDFITWNKGMVASSSIIATNGSNYVFLMSGGMGIYHSTDLVTWDDSVKFTSPSFGSGATTYHQFMLSGFPSGFIGLGLFYGNGLYVVVGYPNGVVTGKLVGETLLVYYTSPDGITWTSHSITNLHLALANEPTGTEIPIGWGYTSAGFTILTNYNYCTCADGSSGGWTVTLVTGSTATSTQLSTDIFYASNDTYSSTGLAAFAATPYQSYSKTVIVPATPPLARDVVGAGDTVVYLDNYQNKLFSSLDNGQTWTQASIGLTPIILGVLPVTDTNGLSAPVFIAMSANVSDGYYTSPEGLTWTRNNFPSGISSSASLHWKSVNVLGSYALDDSVRGTFSVITYVSSTYKRLNTVDGTNWNVMTVNGDAVTVFKNKMLNFLYSQANADASTSYSYWLDFISQQTASPTLIQKVGILASGPFNNSYLVASGAFGLQCSASDGNVVVMGIANKSSSSTMPINSNLYYSYDGIYWTNIVIPNTTNNQFNWNKVVWTGDYFLAIPGTIYSLNSATSYVVARSFDGINWQMLDIEPFFNFDISDVPSNLRIFTCGTNDVFLTVDGVSKIWKVNTGSPQPYTNYVPSDIQGTKWVVKAVI